MKLRIFRRESPVRVLGPGARAVIWVQGCAFHCRGCIVPESWRFDGGMVADVDELAEWAARRPGIEGVTLSGGEPMSQAEALCALIDGIRSRSDLGIVCYTGHTLENLQAAGDRFQTGLLSRIDLLIDGVYRQDAHANLLWRGSSNQRLIALTPRYRPVVDEALSGQGADSSAGVELSVDDSGAVGFVGVPAQPGFREDFVERMRKRGIALGFDPAQKA